MFSPIQFNNNFLELRTLMYRNSANPMTISTSQLTMYKFKVVILIGSHIHCPVPYYPCSIMTTSIYCTIPIVIYLAGGLLYMACCCGEW